MEKYTITLTEEQLNIVLAGLSDRICMLVDAAIAGRRPESNRMYHKVREATEAVNIDIRKQTGRL